jgi:hypothetical protein
MTSVSNFPARIVVAADKGGRSHVAADDQATTRAETPSFSVADVWATDSVPVSVSAADALDGTLRLDPPRGGTLVRLVAFPPDAEWKGTEGYAEALSAIGGGGDDDAAAGMHATDTVDVVTMISGELVAVLDDGEVVLRAGDSLIQQGGRHAWSNRTDAPAVMVATMISATRP